MKDVIRKASAFKLSLVEDVAYGKYGSFEEAGRRDGIRGSAPPDRRVKRYGRGIFCPRG
ncbi:MAG: hypothetical protein LBG27_05105 [Spirochaetaceae bacterium]|jgi:hypothetical protein|nr:hypothetical protein [Spirochaetaceae bacterium]